MATVVYFVPFEIETYVPITIDTITCQAREKWILSDNSDVATLNRLLNPGNDAKFDSARVRVKISASNETYFIDAEGVVLTDKHSFKIDKIAFVKFAESLTKKQRHLFKMHHCEN